MPINQFSMTNIGYLEAKAYLKAIEKYKEFINNKTSIDGYSLYALFIIWLWFRRCPPGITRSII